MQDARENLNKVEYSRKDGIQGLYDIMLEHAGGMAVFPDDYSMLSIFLDKIPTPIMSELLNRRGLTPEVNTLAEFVANAIDVEQREKNEAYYRDRRSRGTTPRNPKESKANSTPHNQGNSSTRPLEKNTEKGPQPNNFKSYGRHKPAEKAKIQDKTHGHHHATPKPSNEKWSKKPLKAREGTSNNKGCYNCGSFEHWSNNCPEPRRNRTFVRAARSAMNSGSEKDDESHNDSASNDVTRGYQPSLKQEMKAIMETMIASK